MDDEGASNNERLLAAARTDNEELIMEILEQPGSSFDINHQDGVGNTALHYAVSNQSTDVIEHILCYEGCNVDPINKIEGATPLHLAVKLESRETREYFVKELLDAGAAYTLKNKYGQTALELVERDDDELLSLFKPNQETENIDKGDITYDGDDVASSSSTTGDDESD